MFRLVDEEKLFQRGEIGLFRDDGLSVMEDSGPEKDRKRKSTIRVFKEEGLKLEWKMNVKKVEYLDVILDLDTECYKPFHKLNSKLIYVHSGSNHPRSVLESVPLGINRRLSSISSNEKCFKDEKEDYQRALNAAGNSHRLDFKRGKEKVKPNVHCRGRIGNQNQVRQGIKKGSRNIIYFTPPFNIYCSTNVGRLFRSLIAKHFGRDNKLGKLFNKNMLKMSYSCMPNIRAKISSHNKSLLVRREVEPARIKPCNCQRSRECPLDGHCNVENVIYKAKVLQGDQGGDQEQGHEYVGLASKFKQRYYNHTASFRNEGKREATHLSRFILKLKDRGVEGFRVEWEVLAQETGYSRKSKRCQLCSREKVEILKLIGARPRKALNKRDELYRRCMHRFKHQLGQLLRDAAWTQRDENFVPVVEMVAQG